MAPLTLRGEVGQVIEVEIPDPVVPGGPPAPTAYPPGAEGGGVREQILTIPDGFSYVPYRPEDGQTDSGYCSPPVLPREDISRCPAFVEVYGTVVRLRIEKKIAGATGWLALADVPTEASHATPVDIRIPGPYVPSLGDSLRLAAGGSLLAVGLLRRQHRRRQIP
ncbi:hypothetical protein GCM10010329_77030 [Streptomyces spiroverticillatus]|uniref:Uncharacterized protein n=1 Tax=Streptomyces finlayi TaxID=67296 RepID=A0A918X5K1_9ACTN|nr:hypothetical protein GCM10010329_77030 [Streptomyces spiroverticillatus]GHD13811.1 hypothetical protein GCM10010334_72440 [Streptomyces finlayi]